MSVGNRCADEVVSTGSTNVSGGPEDVVRELCARAAPATLAGSLLAAPENERAEYAHRLAEAGAWVHLDLIDDAYPLGVGVSPDLLAELDPLRDRIEVHLLVSDPARVLPTVLTHRPARVTIQVEDVAAPRGPRLAEAAQECAAAGTALWVGIAPGTPVDVIDAVRTAVDGVLVMLAEPGRAGTVAQPALVARVAALRGFPAGVDGGVTERAFPDLAAAGADHVVMGRRLWALTRADDTETEPSEEDSDDEHSRKRTNR